MRLYWVIGSAVRPEKAGPRTNPTPQAQERRESPRAWLLSDDTSDMAALAATAIPEREIEWGDRAWGGKVLIHVCLCANYMGVFVLPTSARFPPTVVHFTYGPAHGSSLLYPPPPPPPPFSIIALIATY